MSSDPDLKEDTQSHVAPVKKANAPPPLPHVAVNQVTLSLIVRNLTVYAVKEISQFMKTNVHVAAGEFSSQRKLNFLQLIIFIRNQFLKLYVLIKWVRTIENNNFDVMIDLLNWFRGANMTVNNCIWALKANLTSMANAKLPNADLVTALEVLSLERPNLPTHGFPLSGTNEVSPTGLKIPSSLIRQRLQDLNVAVSVKTALMDVPNQMSNYHFRNGRIYFEVPGEFEVQLSTVDRHAPFSFVDLQIPFEGENLPYNRIKLEKCINEILYKSKKPLHALYNFLHNYLLTFQLHLIHLELQRIESRGKYAGGNLSYFYDPKKCKIEVKYWLNSKMADKRQILIGIDRNMDNLILLWVNEDAIANNGMPSTYTNIVNNLESILDEIMFNHARLLRSRLFSKGIFEEDDENSDVLLFHIPTTCLATVPAQLKIDLISGVFFFKNPTPLLLGYIQQINRVEHLEELTAVLQRLKLDKITYVLESMFEKTGCICSKVIKLKEAIPTKLNINFSEEDQSSAALLQKDMFVRMFNWPVNWYLILSIFSSKSSCIIEKRIGKIVSAKGNWELQYLDKTNSIALKLESITYQKIMALQKSTLTKIINNMILYSLNQLKIRNKICSSESLSGLLHEQITQGDSKHTNDSKKNSSNQISFITLELESFLEGSTALNSILESSMFLRIDYINYESRLYCKFKRNTLANHCNCDDLMIHFIPLDTLSFYLSKKFVNLGDVINCLTTFRQRLKQLVILTDVVERLHKNFASESFKITALKPNEISFKYLKISKDNQDCTINIVTNAQEIKNLTVQLSPSNPQHIIQPFIDSQGLNYRVIFNYLQFTSSLFTALQNITESKKNRETKAHLESYEFIDLALHSLNEYQLLYFNRDKSSRVVLLIELRNVSRNGAQTVQYYIHLADDYVPSTSPSYAMVHSIRNKVFLLDSKRISNHASKEQSIKNSNAVPQIVRLGNGVACTAESICNVLNDIHLILTQEKGSTTDQLDNDEGKSYPLTNMTSPLAKSANSQAYAQNTSNGATGHAIPTAIGMSSASTLSI